MDSRGYRAQVPAEEGEPESAVEVKRGIPLETAGVGLLAVVATAAAIFFVIQFASGEGKQPVVPAPIESAGGAPPGAPQAPSGDYGPADAPVQILAIPGHCEGHNQMVQNLQALSKEYPKELHVVITPMGSPEASAEERSCASYLMKVKGREEPGATPGGYTLLAEKTPGQGWTPEELTEQIRDTLNSVRKASGGDGAKAAEADTPPEPAGTEADGPGEGDSPTKAEPSGETPATDAHAGHSH